MLAVFGDTAITIGLSDDNLVFTTLNTSHMAIVVKAKICTQSGKTLCKSICAKATQKSSPLQRIKYTIKCVIILEV